jgi:hypothetical protein
MHIFTFLAVSPCDQLLRHHRSRFSNPIGFPEIYPLDTKKDFVLTLYIQYIIIIASPSL